MFPHFGISLIVIFCDGVGKVIWIAGMELLSMNGYLLNLPWNIVLYYKT